MSEDNHNASIYESADEMFAHPESMPWNDGSSLLKKKKDWWSLWLGFSVILGLGLIIYTVFLFYGLGEGFVPQTIHIVVWCGICFLLIACLAVAFATTTPYSRLETVEERDDQS